MPGIARASLGARSSIYPGRIDVLARQTKIYEHSVADQDPSHHGDAKGKGDHKSSAIAGSSGGKVGGPVGYSLPV